MKQDLTKCAETVKHFLATVPESRDNDMLLAQEIWKAQLKEKGYHTSIMSAKRFFKIMILYYKYYLWQYESIVRARRRLQAKHAELRGEIYEMRLDRQRKKIKEVNEIE